MSKIIQPIYGKFDLADLPDIINKTNKRVAENERRSFYRTTNNWNDKPEFHVEVNKVYSGGIEDYKVYTDSLKYLWVDEGTDPHVIRPKDPNGYLKIKGGNEDGFQTYYPKTHPNVIESKGSGEYHDSVIFRDGVTQFIEARNFTIMIAEKAPERWGKALDTEIKHYVNKKVK